MHAWIEKQRTMTCYWVKGCFIIWGSYNYHCWSILSFFQTWCSLAWLPLFHIVLTAGEFLCLLLVVLLVILLDLMWPSAPSSLSVNSPPVFILTHSPVYSIVLPFCFFTFLSPFPTCVFPACRPYSLSVLSCCISYPFPLLLHLFSPFPQASPQTFFWRGWGGSRGDALNTNWSV